MGTKIIKEKKELTFLQWSHIRSSSGTAGTFLKSESTLDGVKKYYKLSNFDPVKGVIGHECVNEIIVDRLLTILGVEHLSYELINADIEIEHKIYSTYLCASKDFKKRGESKVALDDYYRTNAEKGESHYDFCVREGWKKYIDSMIAVDFLILNRDRHGANIEVLRNARAHTLRIAPLFDHGLSLLYSCYENLGLIKNSREIFPNKLKSADKDIIFEGLEDILSDIFIDKIWNMIYERYKVYENL